MSNTALRVGAIFIRHINPDQATEKGTAALKGLVETLRATTVADLGMSSADVVTLLDEVGEEFGVELPEEAITWTDHQQLVDFLDR